MKTIKEKIIGEIASQGPATHHDIADALGIAPKVASAHLCNLRKRGALSVDRKVSFASTGRPCNLWRLA